MSDQDFFFEDEERTEESAPAKASAKQPAAKAGSAAAGVPFAQQSVSMTVAGLVAVCTLLVGVIVGILLPGSAATVNPVVPGTSSAPQLTPEELGSGELPAGHPDISDMGGPEGLPSTGGTATGSGETTANQ